MNRKATVSDPMPDPSDYGPRGNLSLGADLLEWMDRQVDRETFGGRRPCNALLRIGPRRRFAESLASDSNASQAAIGQALLIGLAGDVAGAGREYREACRIRKVALRAVKARLAAATRARKACSRTKEVLEAAIEILREQQQCSPQRPVPSDAELARRVRKRLKPKCSERTIRSYLSIQDTVRKGRGGPGMAGRE